MSTLNPEPYNLTEEDVTAIAASRGIAGVIFMPYWLESSHPKNGLDAIWRTMVQLNDWAGGTWEHVAIGTDFDGFTDPPDDCDSEAQLPKVDETLVEQGPDPPELDAVLGANARRVLRDGCR